MNNHNLFSIFEQIFKTEEQIKEEIDEILPEKEYAERFRRLIQHSKTYYLRKKDFIRQVYMVKKIDVEIQTDNPIKNLDGNLDFDFQEDTNAPNPPKESQSFDDFKDFFCGKNFASDMIDISDKENKLQNSEIENQNFQSGEEQQGDRINKYKSCLKFVISISEEEYLMTESSDEEGNRAFIYIDKKKGIQVDKQNASQIYVSNKDNLVEYLEVKFNDKKIPQYALESIFSRQNRQNFLEDSQQMSVFGKLDPVRNLNLDYIFGENSRNYDKRGESILLGNSHMKSQNSLYNHDENQNINQLLQMKEEVYVLCLQGVNPNFKQKRLSKTILSLCSQDEITHIYKPNKKAFCFVQFKDEESMNKFQSEQENQLFIQGRKIKIKQADGKDVSKLANKQDHIEHKSHVKNHIQIIGQGCTDIREKVCPYYQISKEEQIQKKQNECLEYLKQIKKEILQKKCCQHTIRSSWLKNDTSIDNIYQPIYWNQNPTQEYRNKTEYTISLDKESNKIKIGFVLNMREDYPEVSNMTDIPLINPIVYELSYSIENFLNSKMSQKFTAFNQKTKTGHYRYLLIRQSEETKQLIIKLVTKIEDQEMEDFLEEIKGIVNDIKMEDFILKSFIIEKHNDNSNAVPNMEENEIYIYGNENFILEKINGFSFKVPIGGFFQIHPNLAGNLINEIENLININEDTILLDICAGTGMLGITLGQKAEQVYFIECNQGACKMIEDNIKLNAENQCNFVNKSKIFPQKIEDCMAEISQEIAGKGKRVVAIVDPPRAGLHPNVVKSLRTFIGVDEIIFISCSLKQAKSNIVSLCCEQSKNCKGPPFSPLSVRAFDIFPFTNHFETILYLKRLME